ncbi:hypothetical protein Aperf_G00000102185 [Anoplocephala perfoliata]
MTSILPKKIEDFGSSDYWNEFFTKRDTSFEWYGDFATLVEILIQNIRKTDSILEVGCGNSTLSAEIYDKVGCASYLGIDYSRKAIEQSQKLAVSSRPNLRFELVDVFRLHSELDRLEFPTKEFNCIIDKGTLDAIDNGRLEEAQINQYFEEINSAMSLFGRYIIVTLAQDHIIRHISNYFLKEGSPWIVSCIQVTNPERGDAEGASFSMPLFAFVMTKMKASPVLPQLRLKAVGEDQLSRPDQEVKAVIKQRLIDWIKYLQTSCVLDQSRVKTKDDREFEIVHSEIGVTMFTCRIVVASSLGNRKPQPKGILLVPRAQAAFYATPEGAQQALVSMGRLTCAVLAFPHPALRFISLEVAKSQLSDGLCASPLASAVRNAPIYSTSDSYLQMREIKANPPYALITEALKKRKPPPRLLVRTLDPGNVYRFISTETFSEASSILLITWITLTRRLADTLGHLGAKFIHFGVPPCLHKAIMNHLYLNVEDENLKNLVKEINPDTKFHESPSEECALMCCDPASGIVAAESLSSFIRSAEEHLLPQCIGCVFQRSKTLSPNLEVQIEEECGSSLQLLLRQDFEDATVYVIYKKKPKLSKAKFAARVRQIGLEALGLKNGAFTDAVALGCSSNVIDRANECLSNLTMLLGK